jgi:fluoroquinolone transport system ATP-binding protein
MRHAEPTVVVDRLQFRYPHGQGEALAGISFTIGRGQIFGLLGPSGAGKSTTQHILTGRLRGYTGRVTVFGQAPAAWGPSYYERIGVAFELPTHIRKLSGYENLAFFAALYRKNIFSPDTALEQVGLAHARDVAVEHYSKGMLNRLSLARALLHGPELLFLDEPTSGLDPVTARQIVAIIEEQRRAGCTIFLTTHNMQLAEQLCDQVAFLANGQIQASGAPHDLQLAYGPREQRQVVVTYRQGAVRQQYVVPLAAIASDPHFGELLSADQIETIHSTEVSLEQIFADTTA